MVLPFRCNIGYTSFFGSVKGAEVDLLFIYPDARHKPVVIRGDTCRKLVASISTHVLHVLQLGRFAQIVPAIVGALPVDMVNVNRVVPSYQLPDDAVAKPQSVIDRDNIVVSASKKAACRLAGIAGIPYLPTAEVFEMVGRPPLPRQLASSAVVAEALAQIRLIWQFLGSHLDLAAGSLVRAASAFSAPSRPAIGNTLS